MSRRSFLRHVNDNRANQLNPTHPAYYLSRGATREEAAERAARALRSQENRASQVGPEASALEHSRGLSVPPPGDTGPASSKRQTTGRNS